MVHFNGTTFDVPFLQTRAKKFGLSFVPASVQHDIYKKISPYKNLLHLPGCRQKQLEEFIGIHREDHFNGGSSCIIPTPDSLQKSFSTSCFYTTVKTSRE
jgi:uncharacterized protein YprB with RNaseH-like and TPR domain